VHSIMYLALPSPMSTSPPSIVFKVLKLGCSDLEGTIAGDSDTCGVHAETA
jgi:hypothetical protein